MTVRRIATESVLKVNTLLHRGAVLGCFIAGCDSRDYASYEQHSNIRCQFESTEVGNKNCCLLSGVYFKNVSILVHMLIDFVSITDYSVCTLVFVLFRPFIIRMLEWALIIFHLKDMNVVLLYLSSAITHYYLISFRRNLVKTNTLAVCSQVLVLPWVGQANANSAANSQHGVYLISLIMNAMLCKRTQ